MANPPTPGLVTALKIHNDARAAKKLAPLTWDDNLASQATDYAKHLASANKGLQHSTNRSNPPQGENLYAEMGLSTPPAAAAAQAWINEGAKWSEEMKIGEGDFGSYGHYSEYFFSPFIFPG